MVECFPPSKRSWNVQCRGQWIQALVRWSGVHAKILLWKWKNEIFSQISQKRYLQNEYGCQSNRDEWVRNRRLPGSLQINFRETLHLLHIFQWIRKHRQCIRQLHGSRGHGLGSYRNAQNCSSWSEEFGNIGKSKSSKKPFLWIWIVLGRHF